MITQEKAQTLKDAFNQVLEDHGIDNHKIYQFSLVPKDGAKLTEDDCQGKICLDPLGNPICVPIDTPC